MSASTNRRVSKREGLIAAAVVIAAVAIVAWRTTATAEPGPSPEPTTTTSIPDTTTTPPEAAPVPDGKSFAYVKEIDGDRIVIDLAELLTGEEARRAAVEDGLIGEGEDLPNDVYIRNTDKESYQLEVAPDAKIVVLVFDDGGSIVEEQIKLNQLEVAFTGSFNGLTIYGLVAGEFPVTIEIEGGVVTGFQQVYLP